jgi:FkbM family methyltransferase
VANREARDPRGLTLAGGDGPDNPLVAEAPRGVAAVLLPSKTVVRTTASELHRGDLVVALICAVTSVVLTGLVLEAVTDRDWSVQGWEWANVMVAASVVTLGVLWRVSLRPSRGAHEPGGFVKQLVKTELKHLGYTVQRVPSPAFDPAFVLEIDFEYVLDHYLASRDDPRPFFFLQVGAHDGVVDDQLHEHIRRGNWHGMLLEPQSHPFSRLVQNYAGLEGLTFVNAAISEQSGPRELFVIQDEGGRTLESFSGTASFREEPLQTPHRKAGPQGSRIGSVEVTCTTFADVLVGIDYLDLLQIDVEGYDLELLKLFDFGRIRPAIVRFEHRHLSASELDDAVVLLARYGYRVVREEYDTTAYSPLVPA